MQFNRIIAPAVAGLLVGWAGEKACFYVDSLTFVFSATMLYTIAMARPPAVAGTGLGSVLEQLVEGLRFLFQHKGLRFVSLSMVAAIFAIGAFDAQLVVYVRDILHSKSQVFGGLVSLVGVGLIPGAFIIGKFGQKQSKVQLVALGILGLGAGVFLLAATNSVAVALASGVALGIAVSAVLVPSQTLFQQETPPSLLGRVSSTSGSLMTTSQFVAVAISGKLATWFGIRNLYFLVALALAATAAVGIFYARTGRLKESRAVTAAT